jgi:hypothetical protein
LLLERFLLSHGRFLQGCLLGSRHLGLLSRCQLRKSIGRRTRLTSNALAGLCLCLTSLTSLT